MRKINIYGGGFKAKYGVHEINVGHQGAFGQRRLLTESRDQIGTWQQQSMRARLLLAPKARLLQSKAAAVGWKRPLLILGRPRSPVEQTSLCAVRKPAQRRHALAMQA